jgi:hypothetical protein
MGAYGSPELHPAIQDNNVKGSMRQRGISSPSETAGSTQPNANPWPAILPPQPPPYASPPPFPGAHSEPPPYAVGPYPPSSYGWPYPYPAPPRSNGLAVASFVLGVVAIVLAWIPVLDCVLAAPAVILGGLSIARANHTPGMTKGLAIAGVVLGAISIVVTFVVFAIFLAVSGVPAH